MANLTFNGTISTDGETTTEVIVTGNQIEGQIVGGPQGETGAQGPQGDPGVVQAVVAGTGVTVDATDPANPEVALSAGAQASLALADSSVQNLADLSITSTATELNYTDGVTSSIQTQLDSKVPTTRTVNGQPLSSNVVLDIDDVAPTQTGNSGKALVTDGTNTSWQTISGGGAVDSVNGQTGTVVLDQDDVADGTTYKQYSATEKTKLSGIETGADVTDATNVAAAGAVMEADTSTSSMSFVVDEDNMASNSATKIPTQQSTKAYVDNSIDTAVPHVDGISSPLFLSPPRETGTMITSWQSGHGWTVTGTGATSNLNDTSDFILGSQSAYGVSNGAGAATNMRKTGMTNIDMTSKSLRLLMKVDGLSSLNSLSIYLGNAGFANYYLTAIYNPGESKTIIDGEWAWLEFNFNGASAPTTSGSPSKATITDIQIRWTDDSTGAVTIHFNGLTTIDDPAPFPNGVVSIQFDDTYISQYTTAAPILDKYGFPASAMTIVDQVGADANHMSLDQLHELHDKHGWEVAAHANTAANHNLTYTGMTTSDVDSDMRAMKQWLVSNGFGDGDYLAYPLGAYDSSVEEVAAKYYSAARTIIPSPANVIPAYSQFRLRSKSVSNTTTTGQIQTLIDNAYSNKNWLILTFHHIVTTPSLSTEFSTANFTTVVDYLASKGIPVRTMGEVMKAATSKYTPNTVTTTAAQTLTNKTLTSPVINTGVSGTAFLDEDDMASNSATKLASQQSIKAYVDTQARPIHQFLISNVI